MHIIKQSKINKEKQMLISGARPSHRVTLVAFWSWWWGYPLSFAFLLLYVPRHRRSGVCNFAVGLPMFRCLPVMRTWFGIEVVVDCLCTEWFDNSYVQRLQAIRSLGQRDDLHPLNCLCTCLWYGVHNYTWLRTKMMFQYCLMCRQSRWVGERNRPVSNSAWWVFQDG